MPCRGRDVGDIPVDRPVGPERRGKAGVGVVTDSRLGRLDRGDGSSAAGVLRVALVSQDDMGSDADDALRSEQPGEAWTVPHTLAARHRPCCAPLGWASCPRCCGPSQYTQPSSGYCRRPCQKLAVTFKPGTHLSFSLLPRDRDPGPLALSTAGLVGIGADLCRIREHTRRLQHRQWSLSVSASQLVVTLRGDLWTLRGDGYYIAWSSARGTVEAERPPPPS